MSRLRPFRASLRIVGAASLAALSLLVTSLTPLAMRASAADESTQSPDVASSQEAATASSEAELADEAAEVRESGVASGGSEGDETSVSDPAVLGGVRSLAVGESAEGALRGEGVGGVRATPGNVGSISGFIYDDFDAVWTTELHYGFAGVRVKLLDAEGHPVLNSDGEETVAVTDSYGNYAFNELPLGSYKVQVVPGEATVLGHPHDLATHVLTYAYGSSHSRAEVGKGRLVTPVPIELTAGSPMVRDVDFAFVKPMSVGGRVYINENENGVQDNDEPGVAGIEISLRGEDVSIVAVHSDGSPVGPVVTDSEGNYRFDNVLPGFISFVYDLPEGFSVPHSPSYFSDGSRFATAFEYKDYFQFHLGLAADGSIGDTVFWDVNRSGGSAPDEGDKLLSGVTVTLSYTTAGGVEKTQSTVTDDNGKYSFTGLAPGDYVVTVDEASLAAACPECNGQTHSPEGVLPAGDGQALALSAKVTLTSAAMLRSDQDWAFAVVADEPGTDEPVAPADPAPADPDAPVVDGRGSVAQPSAPGNQVHGPSGNSGPVLARTGTDAPVLGGMAAMAAIAGILAVAGKRRRQDA